MGQETILIVEDEKDISEMVKYNLEKEGYRTLTAYDGIAAISEAKKKNPDLIILDLMLPDMDGLEVCKSIKNNDLTSGIAVIMLTAKAQETDKIIGLELGADDYVTKPFSPRELMARIKAVLRRGEKKLVDKKVEIGQILVDRGKHKVFVAGESIALTHTEFKLLLFLAQRPGMVLSRERILDGVFGYESESYDRTVDAHIKSLRKKMGLARDYIETVRGAGYRFKES